MDRALRVISFSLLMGLATLLSMHCSQDEPAPFAPADEPAPAYWPVDRIEVAPIDGITTAWHPVPSRLAVPTGAVLELRCAARPGDNVSWTGAEETRRTEQFSFARCAMDAAGSHGIDVIVQSGAHDKQHDVDVPNAMSAQYRCEIEARDGTWTQAGTDNLRLSRAPFTITDRSSNWETVRAIHGASIAALRQTGPEVYRTSVGTVLHFTADASPSSFSSLVEWRVDGRAVALGHQGDILLDLPAGAHTISAGPPGREAHVVVNLYDVKIEADGGFQEGRPISFRAVTDPPGFEDDVTWLASTRSGSVTPTVGSGRVFSVLFSNVVEADGESWVGVRADNAFLAEDAVQGGGCQVEVQEYVGRPVVDPPNGALYFPQLECNAVPPPLDPATEHAGGQPTAITGATVCYYDITAANMAAACDSIFMKYGPLDESTQKRFAGVTRMSVDITWKKTGETSVHIETVTRTVKVYLPRWTNVPPADQAAWDALLAQLELHEQGHVDRYNQGMTLVEQQVPCTSFSVSSSATNDQITSAAFQQMRQNGAYTNMEQSNTDYDAPQSPGNPTGTNHGTENGQNASW